MNLKYVLLGLLKYWPSTGYSLQKRFFKPVSPTLSQIYRTLKEMSNEGLVKSDRIQQEKLPARNVFRITEDGYNELEQWLRESWKLSPIRDTSVQKLWFASLTSGEYILPNIESYKDKRKEELEYYEHEVRKVVDKNIKAYGGPLEQLYWNLALDYIQRRGRAEIEWAEAAMERISSFKLQDITKTRETK